MKILLPALFTVFSATAALACDVARVGDLEIEHAWSRASIGTDRPGVVYVTIRNGGKDDVLTGISTAAADMPMLHETIVTDGIASMPHVMSLPIPAGQTVTLEPGGFHAMLMGLKTPLKKGESFPMTLTFQNAGPVTVTVDILGMGAKGPAC